MICGKFSDLTRNYVYQEKGYLVYHFSQMEGADEVNFFPNKKI